MLIVLHICSFLMSFDSGYTSLDDSKNIVSYIILISPGIYIVTCLGKFDF